VDFARVGIFQHEDDTQMDVFAVRGVEDEQPGENHVSTWTSSDISPTPDLEFGGNRLAKQAVGAGHLYRVVR
jgi:hypothetical protein